MDNVTHSLAGFLIAETYLNLQKESPSKKTRKIVHLASFIANNFPDLDFLYAGLMGPKIGYLIHHRGHTHTLIGIIPLILLVWAAFKFAKGPGVVIALGFLTHIGLDFLNSYGVHPFWPWDKHWYYGDTLFILEPWIWVFVLPVVGLSFLPKPIKAVSWVLLFGLLLFGFKVDFIHRSLLFLLIGTAALYSGGLRFLLPAQRVMAGGFLFILVILTFGYQSWNAKAVVMSGAKEDVEDVVLTPFPANPFCWNLLLVEINKENYVVKRAVVSSSAWVSVTDCPKMSSEEGWAARKKIFLNQGDSIFWVDQYQARISDFKKARQLSCVSDSFFHFSRVPYLAEVSGKTVLGDLRFDWDKKRGQFSMILPQDQKNECISSRSFWDSPTDYLRNEVF